MPRPKYATPVNIMRLMQLGLENGSHRRNTVRVVAGVEIMWWMPVLEKRPVIVWAKIIRRHDARRAG